MTIVDAGVRKPLEIDVVVPIEDMGALGEEIDEPVSGPAAAGPVRRSIWPSMHPRLLDLVEQHRSTIIFVNARRLAERLSTRLNELHLEGENRAGENQGSGATAGDELVMAHHGSLSRERRLLIEDRLKRGELKGLVATSSLELGIDMGAVDLVVQVESPGAVSRGLQRVGRAGHQVGEPSRGTFFPKHRNDLVEAAVVVDRMQQGLIEHTRYPRNPLDVLAQQIVAMVAMEDWTVADLTRVVRSSANYADLGDEVLANVLDLLAGRYPSEEFGELRPRIVWDRIEGVVRARAGAQRLAVTSGGTILDRGLFGVFLPDGTACRRARRGDGLREPTRRDLPAGRLHLAHRGHHPRTRRGDARPRPAGQDAVLARRRARPTAGAGAGARRVRPHHPAPCRPTTLRLGCASGTASTSWPPPTSSPTSTSRPSPRRRRARRPHHRRRALP